MALPALFSSNFDPADFSDNFSKVFFKLFICPLSRVVGKDIIENTEEIEKITITSISSNVYNFVVQYKFHEEKNVTLRLILIPPDDNFEEIAKKYRIFKKFKHGNIEKIGTLLEGSEKYAPGTTIQYLAYFVDGNKERLCDLLPKLNFLERLEILIEIGKAFNCFIKRDVILENFKLENIFLETDSNSAFAQKFKVVLGNFDFVARQDMNTNYLAYIDPKILRPGKKNPQRIYKHIFGMLMWRVVIGKELFSSKLESQAFMDIISQTTLPDYYVEDLKQVFIKEIDYNIGARKNSEYFLYSLKSCWKDKEKLDRALEAIVLIGYGVQSFVSEKVEEPVAKDCALPVVACSAIAVSDTPSAVTQQRFWGISPSSYDHDRSKEYLKHMSRMYPVSVAIDEQKHQESHRRQESKISMSGEELYEHKSVSASGGEESQIAAASSAAYSANVGVGTKKFGTINVRISTRFFTQFVAAEALAAAVAVKTVSVPLVSESSAPAKPEVAVSSVGSDVYSRHRRMGATLRQSDMVKQPVAAASTSAVDIASRMVKEYFADCVYTEELSDSSPYDSERESVQEDKEIDFTDGTMAYLPPKPN